MPKFTTNVQLDGAVVSFESETATDVLTTIAQLRNERAETIVREAIAAKEVVAAQKPRSLSEEKYIAAAQPVAPKPRARARKAVTVDAVVVPESVQTLSGQIMPSEAQPDSIMTRMTATDPEPPTIKLETVIDNLRDYARQPGKGVPAATALIRQFRTASGEVCATAQDIQPSDYRLVIDKIAAEKPQ